MMRKAIQILLFVVFISGFNSAFADVKLPALFNSHMVLQQDTTVKLWGWADPGEKISIQVDWIAKPLSLTTDASGKWSTDLRTLKYDEKAHEILIKGNNELKLEDILFGEVWICGGQSNMSFPIQGTPGHYSGLVNAKQVVAVANHPKLRFITVDRKVASEPQQDIKGEWFTCTPETAAGDISAVSYFFALQLIEKTGFPVGLIGANWGGTPAEAWMNKKILENDKDFKPILERYDATVADWANISQQYKEDRKVYLIKDSIAKANKTKRPLSLAEPVGPNSNKSPYKLYNAIIAPLIPFTIKGVIWYQGENNAVRAYQYRRLFPALIQNWRDEWGNKNLPFYFVQISPHPSQNAVIREAQLYTFEHVKATGMVVTTDNGDSLDIHPRNKELVGNRLSLWALKNQYGKDQIIASGPIYQGKKIKRNQIFISFKYDKELTTKGGDLKEFTIAGKDQVFYPAKATIVGNQIIVSSPKVPKPVAVRFAWKAVPHPNLFNIAGLPASPFRTDDWEVETQGLN
ncbi:MAG: sialate O-acetylesterase [Pelobium sp.]